MFYKVLMPNGKQLVTTLGWWCIRSGTWLSVSAWDLVELEEGTVLNEELNPMELATAEQIKQAQEDSDS